MEIPKPIKLISPSSLDTLLFHLLIPYEFNLFGLPTREGWWWEFWRLCTRSRVTFRFLL